MCVAIPGKVIKIDGTKATVDFSGNIVTAEAGLVDVKVGDRVLVHAGCIIQTMDDKLADEMEELFNEKVKGITTVNNLLPKITKEEFISLLEQYIKNL